MSGVAAVLEWLDARQPAAPEGLRARMAEAVSAPATARLAAEHCAAGAAAPGAAPTRGAWLAAVLAAAAVVTMRRVLAAPGGRAAAYDLLAADALLTYACEAAAEAGLDALEATTHAHDPVRLAELLRPEEE
ncbi:MAG TPA: hypothetical protein VF188_00870 [Longimicrobiales bacterium]